MTQQPAYTPVTDTITNVNVITISNWDQSNQWDNYISSPSPNTFDGNTNTGPGLTLGSGTAYPTWTFDVSTIPIPLSRSGVEVWTEETHLLASVNGGEFIHIEASKWFELETSESSFKTLTLKATQPTFGVSGLYSIKVNGRILVLPGIDNSSAGSFQENELTFNSPQDIVNFRPGDVVRI